MTGEENMVDPFEDLDEEVEVEGYEDDLDNVEDDQPEQRSEADHEDELDEIDERVKARIEAAQARAEAEREAAEELARGADAVSKTAAQLRQENERLKALWSNGEKAYLETFKGKLESDMASAKKAYREAFESGDADALAEAQVKISELAAQRREIENYTPAAFDPPPVIPEVKRKPAPDKAAMEWQQKNDWFGRDEEMSAVALAVHRKLVNSGVHPVNDAAKYYKEIDDTIRRRFPEKFETEEKKAKPRPQVVAGVTKDVVVRNKNTTKVKLTESQVNLARRLGLTPQQYAEQLIKEMRDER